MLQVARTIVMRDGLRALTMSALVKESGAPSGSVYHRFPSRDHLLQALWIDAVERFQGHILEEIEGSVAIAGTDRLVAISGAVVAYAEAHPGESMILSWYRREDLSRSAEGGHGQRASANRQALDEAFARLAKELDVSVGVVALAIARLPLMLLRPALERGKKVSGWERDALRRMIHGLMTDDV